MFNKKVSYGMVNECGGELSNDAGTAKSNNLKNYESADIVDARVRAKLLFREMQLLEPEVVVKILSNKIIEQYAFEEECFVNNRPVSNDAFPFKNTKAEKKSLSIRRASIVASEEAYQKKLWNSICAEAKIVLLGLAKSSKKVLAMEKLIEALRFKDLRSFLCKEQAIQIAFLQALKSIKDENIELIRQYIDKVENAVISGELVRAPEFFTELRRAIQLTTALRHEAALLQCNKRVEPKNAMNNNSEFTL